MIKAVREPISMPPIIICRPATHTTTSVVTLMASAETGCIRIIIFRADMLLSIRAVLIFRNFSFSYSSRTKDLITFSLVIVSPIPVFSVSICSCITV